jgi:hypothetical protein
MPNPDYFFLIFLGTIAVVRFLLIKKITAPTIQGFRLRHYMYGIVLLGVAIVIHNLATFAIGLGLIVDELPVFIVRGPGHKDEYWHGCDDYHSKWSTAGLLIFILLVFAFRDIIVGTI